MKPPKRLFPARERSQSRHRCGRCGKPLARDNPAHELYRLRESVARENRLRLCCACLEEAIRQGVITKRDNIRIPAQEAQDPQAPPPWMTPLLSEVFNGGGLDTVIDPVIIIRKKGDEITTGVYERMTATAALPDSTLIGKQARGKGDPVQVIVLDQDLETAIGYEVDLH